MNTHFVLLLDESGSMCNQKTTVISGVNDLIETLHQVCDKTGQKVTLSLFTMTDDIKEIFKLEDVQQISHITSKSFNPGGGNRIQLCIHETINIMDKALANCSYSPLLDDVVFIVFTDGGECHQPTDEIKEQLKEQLARTYWTCAYIGPHQAEGFATNVGFKQSNIAVYQTDNKGTRAMFSVMALAAERYMMKKFDLDINRQDFFTGLGSYTTMEASGLKCVLNLPKALRSRVSTDLSADLPSYAPQMAYNVDEYPASPSNWMRGDSKSTSYFVAVEAGHGMWLDFNNNYEDPWDVSIVVSVQGVNPVTGQKTDKLNLEQYKTRCPIHDVEFQSDRYCKECNFKWPAQNYITTTTTMDGMLWIDGFRTEDGKVRQYLFTEEKSQGVATMVVDGGCPTAIDRVYAIGVAYYRSKAKKIVPYRYGTCGFTGPTGYSGYSGSAGIGGYSGYSGVSGFSGLGGIVTTSSTIETAPSEFATPMFFSPMHTPESWDIRDALAAVANDGTTIITHHAISGYAGASGFSGFSGASGYSGTGGTVHVNNEHEKTWEPVVTLKSYEVAAGVAISQAINPDSQDMDYWDTEPAGIIYINYADPETVGRILAAGKRNDKKEGFLTGIPVGN